MGGLDGSLANGKSALLKWQFDEEVRWLCLSFRVKRTADQPFLTISSIHEGWYEAETDDVMKEFRELFWGERR